MDGLSWMAYRGWLLEDGVSLQAVRWTLPPPDHAGD